LTAALRGFVRLTPADRWLVIEAALLVAVVRPGVVVLRMRTLRRALLTYARLFARRSPGSVDTTARVGWAIEAATRRVPGRTSCLVDGLVGEAMLRRQGLDATLRIGVRRPDGGALAAHAWVECDDRIVIGGLADHRDYAPLVPELAD